MASRPRSGARLIVLEERIRTALVLGVVLVVVLFALPVVIVAADWACMWSTKSCSRPPERASVNPSARLIAR